MVLKFMWNYERLRIEKTILSKKNKARRITPTDFKIHYKVIALKIQLFQYSPGLIV